MERNHGRIEPRFPSNRFIQEGSVRHLTRFGPFFDSEPPEKMPNQKKFTL